MGAISFFVSAFYSISFILCVVATIFLKFDVDSSIDHYERHDSCEELAVFYLELLSIMVLLVFCYFIACLTWFCNSFKMEKYAKIMATIVLIHVMINVVFYFARYELLEEYKNNGRTCHYKPLSMNALNGGKWLIAGHAFTFGLVNYSLLSLAAKMEEKDRNDTTNNTVQYC